VRGERILKAIRSSGEPEKINIDKSGANTAGIQSHNADQDSRIEIRQVKYLNNVVESDHRNIKTSDQANDGIQKFQFSQGHSRRN